MLLSCSVRTFRRSDGHCELTVSVAGLFRKYLVALEQRTRMPLTQFLCAKGNSEWMYQVSLQPFKLFTDLSRRPSKALCLGQVHLHLWGDRATGDTGWLTWGACSSLGSRLFLILTHVLFDAEVARPSL